MTPKEYADEIVKLVVDYPGLQVVSSSDSEGNRFMPVYFTPTLGHFRDGDEFVAIQIDEYHGCALSPARCEKINRSIYPQKDLNGKSFPSWCPREDKK